jgi:hypothetical protein
MSGTAGARSWPNAVPSVPAKVSNARNTNRLDERNLISQNPRNQINKKSAANVHCLGASRNVSKGKTLHTKELSDNAKTRVYSAA